MSSIVTCFGEIMGRIQPEGYNRIRQAFPGKAEITFAGAEASVAVSLEMLGRKSLSTEYSFSKSPIQKFSGISEQNRIPPVSQAYSFSSVLYVRFLPRRFLFFVSFVARLFVRLCH